MPYDASLTRPDPAELLARIQREQGEAPGGGRRGRLKIFFGMAPGVGKTYAMLASAQRQAAQGIDVVVGIVETHGRAETEQLLLGLDILPRKKVEYSGGPAAGSEARAAAVTLTEFDVDAAIARRPDILLVDELAHTNAPGSARQKRWQDVQECLNAGVNVYTTLNVQHLESINDVVAQITGVSVRETVPDAIFDEADEVELVDVPVETLHERLKAGKVYVADNAARAVDPSDGFFRKGNLTALREIALRRTAAWVDSELREYKQDTGIRAVWPAGERILVAVSPSPFSGRLVRAAKRMAAGMHADLLAVYVETPRSRSLSAVDRERLTQNLQLAESLGATTTIVTGENAARELIAFSRSRNVSRIVVGKTERPRWREAIFGSFISNLIRESGDVDIYVVRGDDAPASPRAASAADDQHTPGPRRPISDRLTGMGAALLMVGAITLVGNLAFRNLELANIAMIYLAAVVVSALWFGRGAALFAAIAGVAAFDFFFVPPRMTFAVTDAQYALTFAIMAAVGMLVGHLTARTREQGDDARDRERRTAALFALSRELAAARDQTEVARIAARHLSDIAACDALIAVPRRPAGAAGAAAGSAATPPAGPSSAIDVLAWSGEPDWFDDREKGVAEWALDHGRSAGLGTQRLPAAKGRHVPLVGTSGKVGLFALRPRAVPGAEGAAMGSIDAVDAAMLDACASQIASALERVALGEARQAARLEAERERLRSALLSSVSHDLRTPLASITGAATTLEHAAVGGRAIDPATEASLLHTIVHESSRLNDIIANLVFATRLESGAVTLRREWTTVEEVVGVGLARHREELAKRSLGIHLASDLPMIRVDNAMLPQVIHNLVENALRYTPETASIEIAAWEREEQVFVKVADDGPGLADDEAAKVFERFYRGRAARHDAAGANSARSGMGLGLTICEGVVRAHGGRIWAEPNSPRGVAFLFTLPVEHPQPPMPHELNPQVPNAAGPDSKGIA